MFSACCYRIASNAYQMPWNHRSLEPRLRNLRGQARHLIGWRRHPLPAFIMKATATCIWPFVLPLAAFSAVREHGGYIRSVAGKSALHQFVELLRFGLGDLVVPKDYYCFGMFRPEVAGHRAEYLVASELDALNDYLNEFRGLPVIAYKDRFEEYFGIERGFPTIPVLACIERGKIQWFAPGSQTLPASDLFVKPSKGCRGVGAESWRWQADGRYENAQLGRKTSAELLQYLQLRSESGRLVLQPRAENHPALVPLSSGALSSIRMVTARRLSGKVELLVSEFLMSVSNSTVSNFSEGGLSALIVDEHGTLGPAYGANWKAAPLDRHPATDAQIAGARIPQWDELVELVCTAHEAFADCVVLGWDVAVTVDGPVLIEANDGWSGDTFQEMPVGKPLLKLEFAEICLEYIAKHEANRDRDRLRQSIRQYRRRKKQSMRAKAEANTTRESPTQSTTDSTVPHCVEN